MRLLDDIIGSRIEKAKQWFYAYVLPNPSGQDQLSDHLFPNFFTTSVVLWIPKFGPWLALIFPLLSLYKELFEDLHYKDLFSNSESGKDGRIDLFFRLIGSAIAYIPLLWRIG